LNTGVLLGQDIFKQMLSTCFADEVSVDPSAADLVSAHSFAIALIIILSNATRAVVRRAVKKAFLDSRNTDTESVRRTANVRQILLESDNYVSCVRASTGQLRVSTFLELVANPVLMNRINIKHSSSP